MDFLRLSLAGFRRGRTTLLRFGNQPLRLCQVFFRHHYFHFVCAGQHIQPFRKHLHTARLEYAHNHLGFNLGIVIGRTEHRRHAIA